MLTHVSPALEHRESHRCLRFTTREMKAKTFPKAQNSPKALYIVWSLGPKAFTCESVEPKTFQRRRQIQRNEPPNPDPGPEALGRCVSRPHPGNATAVVVVVVLVVVVKVNVKVKVQVKVKGESKGKSESKNKQVKEK